MWPRKASKYETLLASWPNKTLQMVTEPSWWIHTADPKLETLHFTRIPSWPSIAACTKSTSTPLHVTFITIYIWSFLLHIETQEEFQELCIALVCGDQPTKFCPEQRTPPPCHSFVLNSLLYFCCACYKSIIDGWIQIKT
jgi:hypothetical protein